MTRLNTMAFVLIAVIIVVTTMLYGAVHPPIIELFYLLVVALLLLWALDGLWSGKIAVSNSRLQLPLAAFAVYGLVQLIPFGNYTADGVERVPRGVR